MLRIFPHCSEWCSINLSIDLNKPTVLCPISFKRGQLESSLIKEVRFYSSVFPKQNISHTFKCCSPQRPQALQDGGCVSVLSLKVRPGDFVFMRKQMVISLLSKQLSIFNLMLTSLVLHPTLLRIPFEDSPTLVETFKWHNSMFGLLNPL